MNYGIALLSIIPVRKLPDERSEMTNQILFGETLIIHEIHDNWSKIETCHDNFEGWVDTKMVTNLASDEFESLQNSSHYTITKLVEYLILQDNSILPLVFGSTVPFKDSLDQFTIADKNFKIFKNSTKKTTDRIHPKEKVIDLSYIFLNAPYLWGGRSSFGIDCSGLVQVLFKSVHRYLPRNAAQQYISIPNEISLEKAEAGDLAFFTKETIDIIHVGIVFEKGKIIHSSGKVKIDNLDNKGIFSNEMNKYTHNLAGIKRVIN